MLREQAWNEWERLKPRIIEVRQNFQQERNEKYGIIRKVMDLRTALDSIKQKFPHLRVVLEMNHNQAIRNKALDTIREMNAIADSVLEDEFNRGGNG